MTWNDGGPQIPNFYHALEPVPRGEIVAYEHCDAYTYVAADLTRAYSSKGANVIIVPPREVALRAEPRAAPVGLSGPSWGSPVPRPLAWADMRPSLRDFDRLRNPGAA